MKSAPFILMALFLLFTGSKTLTLLGFGVIIGLLVRGK